MDLRTSKRKKRLFRLRGGAALMLALSLVLQLALPIAPAAMAAGPEAEGKSPDALAAAFMRNAAAASMEAIGGGSPEANADAVSLFAEEASASNAQPLSWPVQNVIPVTGFTGDVINQDTKVKMSSDGRYISYNAWIFDQSSLHDSISIYDRLTGHTDRIRIPGEPGGASLVQYDLSGDGRFVAFSAVTGPSDAADSERRVNVFLADRITGGMKKITVNDEAYNPYYGGNVSISEDGSYVAFDSSALGLVGDDDDSHKDVFLYDRAADSVRRISHPSGMAAEKAGDSSSPSISADGRYVAFVSNAGLVDADPYTYTTDIYVYDREGGDEPFRLISGSEGGRFPSISADGEKVAFEGDADDGLGSTEEGIFVYDTQINEKKLVSKDSDGKLLPIESETAKISKDGRYVGFENITTGVYGGNESRAYVADVAAQTAYPATATSRYQLIEPSYGTVVGSGGSPVAYVSHYMTSYSNSPASFGGIFVQASGDEPTWPAGSQLQTVRVSRSGGELSWPNAVDPGHIAGYHIYEDEAVIGFVPADNAGGNTFTFTEDWHVATHSFRVEAVDSNFNESYGGPSVTLFRPETDGGGDPGNPGGSGDPGESGEPVTLSSVSWFADQSRFSSIVAGSKLQIIVRATTGKEATAEIDYQARTNEAGAETRHATVSLTESSPGNYAGTYRLEEGTSEISSIAAKVSDPSLPGGFVEKTAEGLPAWVVGTAVVAFDNPHEVDLKNSMLTVRSSNSADGMTYVLKGSDPVSVKGLIPDTDYTLTLRSRTGVQLATPESVRVAAGGERHVGISVEPPAKVRIRIVENTSTAAAGVKADLYDRNHQFVTSVRTGNDGWTDWTDQFKAGESVIVKVDVVDRLAEPVQDRSILLNPFENEVEIRLVTPKKGELTGVVRTPDGKPAFNAAVTSTQSYKGKPVVNRAVTNVNGVYRLTLLAGEAAVEASEESHLYRTESAIPMTIAADASNVLDVQVRQPDHGIINLDVHVKYIDSDWIGPVDMKQMGFRTTISRLYNAEVGIGGQSGGGGFIMPDSGYDNAYYSHALHNERVNVCVTGIRNMGECRIVTLDDQANATVRFDLEEKGGRILGTLAKRENSELYHTQMHKLDEEGRLGSSVYIGYSEFKDGVFDMNMKESGTYLMELDRRYINEDGNYAYEFAKVQFTVAEKQILQLGTISFEDSRYFSNRYSNNFIMTNGPVVPGRTVGFQVKYGNVNESVAEDARLLIDVPEGMSPVADSHGNITVSGDATGAVSLEGRTLIVPVGTLAKSDEGAIRFQMTVDRELNQNSLSASARISAKINGKQIEETIGSIRMDVPMISMNVPKKLSAAVNFISGFAPSGSSVKLYDSNELIGGAAASQDGYWSLKATIADLGDPSTHALRAEADTPYGKLVSPISYVSYDTKKPRLVSIAMAQPPKDWVTADVRQGTASLPYRVEPDKNPIEILLTFDRPDQVDNVRVYIDGQAGAPVKAEREGELYHAYIPINWVNWLDGDWRALGGVYVDYDMRPEPFRTEDHLSQSLDEVRQSLPPAMRDFEYEVVEPFELHNGQYTGKVKYTFPQLEGLSITTALTVRTDADYEPTPAEVALAEQSGSPLINGTIGISEDDAGLTVRSSGYLPTNLLFPEGVKASDSSKEVRTLAVDIGGSASAVTMETYVQYGPAGDTVGVANKIKGQYDGLNTFSGKINTILSKAQASIGCTGQISTVVGQAGKALVATVAGEVGKFALDAWTGAMGLSGPLSIAAAGITAAASSEIDSFVDESINDVGTGIGTRTCTGDRSYYLSDMDLMLQPRWLYDPSGYVYEAVPDNRLSGVQATALYQDPDSGDWVVWDAAPYAQTNPVTTDSKGMYAWDVPKGKWKVVWEKDGYERQESAELDVPPPRTEVNAGLVSLEAPQVQSAAGYAGAAGSYIDIAFSKYMRVTELSGHAVTVTDSNHAAVEGTVAFLDPEVNPADPGGAKLSRIVRFTPSSEALAVGGSYTVSVNASELASYAGVWMNEGFEGAVTIQPRDELGPEAVGADLTGGGAIVRVTFNEDITDAVDAAKFAIAKSGGSAAGMPIMSAVSAGDGRTTRTVLLTLAEPLGAGSTIEITALPGAVVDAAGNGSTQKALTASSAAISANAALSQLAVAGSKLFPAFQPERPSYDVYVADSVEQLNITATAADAKSALTVGGMAALDGVAKAAAIPDDGTIAVRVKAEDGVTERVYLVHVNRGDEPDDGGDGGGPGPIGGSGGGSTAPNEAPSAGAWTAAKYATESSGAGMRIDLHAAAMEQAIRQTEDGQRQLPITVTGEADEYVLQITAEALAQLKKLQAGIVFEAGGTVASIPAALLAGLELPAQAVWKLTIGRMANNDEQAGFAAANAQSGGALLPAGSLTAIRLGISQGDAAAAAYTAPADHPIEFTLSVDGTKRGTPAVYGYDPVTRQWTYEWDAIQNRTSGRASFKLYSSGAFAVLNFANPFTDTATHWAANDIAWMAQRLLVNGRLLGAFRPNEAITRAEFAVLLVRALGLPAAAPNKAVPFADVSPKAWYYDDVEAAAAAGIVEGAAGGRFAPGAAITREEMAVIIWRAYAFVHGKEAAAADLAPLKRFEDSARISEWAKQAAAFALEKGLMQGMSSAEFGPSGSATRAQAAALLKRLLLGSM